MQNNIDENLVYYYSNTVSNRWLALRLEIVRIKKKDVYFFKIKIIFNF